MNQNVLRLQYYISKPSKLKKINVRRYDVFVQTVFVDQFNDLAKRMNHMQQHAN